MPGVRVNGQASGTFFKAVTAATFGLAHPARAALQCYNCRIAAQRARTVRRARPPALQNLPWLAGLEQTLAGWAPSTLAIAAKLTSSGRTQGVLLEARRAARAQLKWRGTLHLLRSSSSAAQQEVRWVKYGSLLIDSPFEPDAGLAWGFVLGPCLISAALLLASSAQDAQQ